MGIYYDAGHMLLTALAGLEDDIKHNYEQGTVQQRALANIAGLQGDLFASYLILLSQGPIIGRAVILRSILENQGNIMHLKGNDLRSGQYLAFADKMRKQLKNRVEDKKTAEADKEWSSSKISHRVAKVSDSAGRLYDTLSDFVHGNNVQGFFDAQELTEAYINATDSYFIGLFIGFLIEIGTGLEISLDKQRMVLDAIERANKMREASEK